MGGRMLNIEGQKSSAEGGASQESKSGGFEGPARDLIGYGRDAPKIEWPGGIRLAVNLVIVYEEGSEYSIPAGDGRNEGWGEYNIQIGPDIRDLGTETHFEYGSRVGIWRLVRLLERFKIPATISATAKALEMNPEVVAWMKQSQHDLLGHGLRWTELYTMSREQERRELHESVALYSKLTGERPLGWNSRSFPSVHTFDLIKEEGGFEYYSDPCNDDIPYFVEAPAGRLLVVPYSKTYNDSRFLIAPGYGNPMDFVQDVCAGIDFLLDEAEDAGARMMTVAVHARWTGQGNRASGLKRIIEHAIEKPGVAFMRRLDMARHFTNTYGHLPTLPLRPGTSGSSTSGSSI